MAKPADIPKPPADQASGGIIAPSEAKASTMTHFGQLAAVTGTPKRDRPQPGSAAAARGGPSCSQAAGTEPVRLLQGPDSSPSHEVGTHQGCAANGKQAASAANGGDETKEQAATKLNAAKMLAHAKKAMPRYAPPPVPQPAASKPKLPAALPLGPWAAGPPPALQAAPD